MPVSCVPASDFSAMLGLEVDPSTAFATPASPAAGCRTDLGGRWDSATESKDLQQPLRYPDLQPDSASAAKLPPSAPLKKSATLPPGKRATEKDLTGDPNFSSLLIRFVAEDCWL